MKFTLFLWLLEILFMLSVLIDEFKPKIKNLLLYDIRLHISVY